MRFILVLLIITVLSVQCSVTKKVPDLHAYLCLDILLNYFDSVSSANAFVLRGGIPVFVDIRPDTLNIDETLNDKYLEYIY